MNLSNHSPEESQRRWRWTVTWIYVGMHWDLVTCVSCECRVCVEINWAHSGRNAVERDSSSLGLNVRSRWITVKAKLKMQEIHGSVIDQTNGEKDGDNQNQNVDVRRMVCRYRLSSLLPRRALLIKRLRERATGIDNVASILYTIHYTLYIIRYTRYCTTDRSCTTVRGLLNYTPLYFTSSTTHSSGDCYSYSYSNSNSNSNCYYYYYYYYSFDCNCDSSAYTCMSLCLYAWYRVTESWPPSWRTALEFAMWQVHLRL